MDNQENNDSLINLVYNEKQVIKKIEQLLEINIPFLGEREEKRDAPTEFDHYVIGYSKYQPEDFIDQIFFVGLKELDDKIENLLELVNEFKSLEAFYMVDCQLTKIPNNIGKLINLSVLSIIRTPITTISDELGKMENLRTLNIAKTNLETLPTTLEKLTKLRSLWLNKNKLREIPDVFSNFKDLSYFAIDNNPLVNWPKSVFETNPKAIIFPRNLRDEVLVFLGIPFDKENFKPLQERYTFKDNTIISFV